MANEDGETEESGSEQEEEEESDSDNEEVDEVDEESETKTEKPKEEKDKPDPLVIDYAESLKKSLGKEYDADLDKLPIRERINIMKHLSSMKSKMRAKTAKAAKARVPQPTQKSKKKAGGVDYKALGEKYT